MYSYPTYKIDLTDEILKQCCEIAIRLLKEVGMIVRHKKFLDAIKDRTGIKIAEERIYFDETLVRNNIEKFIVNKKNLEQKDKKTKSNQWTLSSCGFSMCVIDIKTDEIRSATCQDLKELIRLKDSFGIAGSYPVMPQDIPPLMRAIACFKICWENSDKTRPLDYLDIKETKYIYEMAKVVGKPFTIVINVPQTMTISEHDIEVFLTYYPDWKKNKKDVAFYSICDYPMLGINKPITTTGCIALHMAHLFGVYTLFKLFDPEIELPFNISAGRPTDLRHTCWAFGSPKEHLYAFLTSIIIPRLCKLEVEGYERNNVLLESSSCAVDEQAALEKMGVAMIAALQGCRSFSGAGNLCVDDLFSGVQFVIDVEIFNYIKETIEAFNPHPDIISMDGLYEMLRDVSLEKDQFLSHPDTVTKFRNILPSSHLLHREKLRSWLIHKKTLKDRAKEECLKRMREENHGFCLPSDKQKALNEIYRKAERDLVK